MGSHIEKESEEADEEINKSLDKVDFPALQSKTGKKQDLTPD